MTILNALKSASWEWATDQQLHRGWINVCASAVVALMLLILGLPPADGWTLSLIALGVLLAVIAPSIMITIVLLTVPVQEALLLPYFRGDLTLTQIAVFGLVIGWGMTFWRYRILVDSITLWYIAIGSAFCIALVEMDEFGLWAGEVYRWGVAAVFFVICRSVLQDWRQIRIVLWGVVGATLGTWAFSFGQLVAGNGPDHMFRGGTLRVPGLFGTPNPLAAYVEFAIPMLLVLALLGLRRSFRNLIGAPLWLGCVTTSLLGIVVLALTQSRGGTIGFAAAMVVVFLILPKRIRISTAIVGIMIIVVISLTPAGQSQLHRFGNVFENAPASTGSPNDFDTGRGSLWVAAIRMFEDKPWTGVGAGEYDYHYREYTPHWYDRFPKGQAHNGWLQMAAQAGLAGVVAFTGWVVAALVSLVGAARRSIDPLARALAMGALAVMVAFAVHSLVDYLNVLSLGLQLSAIAAIGLNLTPGPCRSRSSRSFTGGASLHSGLA